jgi:hypothetical protein
MKHSRTSVWRVVVIAALAGCDAGTACTGCDFPRFTVSSGDAGAQTTSAVVATPPIPPSLSPDSRSTDATGAANSSMSAASGDSSPGGGSTGRGYSVIYRHEYGDDRPAASSAPPPAPRTAEATEGGTDGAVAPPTEYPAPAPPDLVIIPAGPAPRPEDVRPVAPRPPLNGGTSYPVPVMPTGGVFNQPHPAP